MFALTRKTDYAIIALTEMARRDGEVLNARQIAERHHIPSALLVKVLKILAQGELVRSIRGARGGYSLALPAGRITLGSIIATVEGPVRFVQCATEPEAGESPCELMKNCPVSRPMRRVHEKLKALLSEVTLAEIAFDRNFIAPPAGAGVRVSVEGHAVA